MSWDVVAWFAISGLILAAMGTIGPLLKRIWLSCSIIYLLAGIAIGPACLDLVAVDLVRDAKLVEHVTEVAVIVSLFAAGIKMRSPLEHGHWIPPTILASVTMILCVAGTAVIGSVWLGLPWVMALLLGAVLAPTDPVLAGEVQLEHPDDHDGLRRTLTGEAGLNDGTAFPMVLLAVGLMNPDWHSIGPMGLRWFAVDVVYKVAAGLLFGYAAGLGMTHALLWVRQRVRSDTASDEMLTLGFIALVYGAALAIDSYAFLAVFCAALAMRKVELQSNQNETAEEAIQKADRSDAEHESDAPKHAASIMTRDSLMVADTMERLVQIVLVVSVGAMLSSRDFIAGPAWAFGALAIFIVRPLSTLATLQTSIIDSNQRRLTAWFGIRGIGTLYYLSHALTLGVQHADPEQLRIVGDAAVATVTLSILLHGTSVTPLMRWYEHRRGKLETT